MSRTALSLPVRDVSAFAKALSRQLCSLGRSPGHLELLNMLARSAGFQNFQHLRDARSQAGFQVEALAAAFPAAPASEETPGGGPDGPRPGGTKAVAEQNFARLGRRDPAVAPDDGRADQSEPVDQRRLNRLLRYFDQSGRMTRWPGKHGQQTHCLWVVWSRFPSGPAGDEAAVNARLATLHTFGDHALLRRELYDRGFLDRTPDGRAYRRLERKPDPVALALIRRVVSGRTG